MTASTSTATIDTTIMVPFNKLVADPENVRATRPSNDIESLANNIEADGLLQNLVVRKVQGGKHAVLAGERRRQALALLVSTKKIKASQPIPCKLIRDESATSASLAENIHRNAMHPADQFMAWKKLADQGLSVDVIATRHGATAALIQRRLKLGRLSPVLLTALQTDEIGLEIAAAFTLVDDHSTQESVYRALSEQNSLSVHRIRRTLTETEISSTHKLAIYVGREAYEQAGGQFRTDLFDEEYFYKDMELLTTLATDKLKGEAEALEAEGWKWITPAFEYDHSWGNGMRPIHEKPIALSEEEEKELEHLRARLDELNDIDEPFTEAEDAEYDKIDAQVDALDAKALAYDEEDKSVAGGYIYLDRSGVVHTRLGLVRSEDDPLNKRNQDDEQAPDANTTAQTETGIYSQSLRNDLAAIRLEILRAELLSHPTLMADLSAFHTVRGTLAKFYTASPINIETRQGNGGRYESAQGDMGQLHCRESYAQRVAALSLSWFDIADELESFKAFLSLSTEEKTALQAYAAVLLLKPQLCDDDGAHPTLEHVVTLAEIDIASHWTPDAGFFTRIKKGSLLEIADEAIAGGFVSVHASKKKGEIVEAMADHFSASDEDADNPIYSRTRSWVPDGMAATPTSEGEK